MSRDISARVLAEEQVKTETRLREIEFRKMLNSVLEHEVRNALAVINLAIDDRLVEPRIAGLVRKSTDNLLQVVEQVGLFSRSDELPKLLAPRDLSVWSVIKEIEQKLAVSHPVRSHGDPAIHVWAEHSLMVQLFEQIIKNAQKYAPCGADIVIACEAASKDNGQMVSIRVSNTHLSPKGIELDRLFEPFYRSAHVSEKSGSGLGLTIAKHLTEMLNGTISVDYVETVFSVTVRLPRSVG